MKYKKYILLIAMFTLVLISCRDESLYPLPYNDRTGGAYLRMYSTATNVLDANDLNNSGFETTFEAVDPENGNLLKEIDFYATFRNASGMTDEVFVKTVPASQFQAVSAPTYSKYKRAKIRITYAETQAALLTAPSQTGGEFWPSLAGKISYPGSLVSGNQVVYRWKMKLTNGQAFTVLNPQNTNPGEANTTPNITGGQYYSSPFQFTVTVRSLAPDSFTGSYQLEQFAIWSPAHSVALHLTAFPDYLNKVLFPSQPVSLAIPTNGLSTQREFSVNYRGANTKMIINFEATDPMAGQAAANISAVVTTLSLNSARARGTVYVQLQNSTVDCSPEREIYWQNPTTGLFGSTARGNNPAGSPASGVDPAIPALKAGLPQGVIPNRGVYYTDAPQPGDVFYVSIDDDADEYGRRNGYCTWTRRVYLKLTKLP